MSASEIYEIINTLDPRDRLIHAMAEHAVPISDGETIERFKWLFRAGHFEAARHLAAPFAARQPLGVDEWVLDALDTGRHLEPGGFVPSLGVTRIASSLAADYVRPSAWRWADGDGRIELDPEEDRMAWTQGVRVLPVYVTEPPSRETPGDEAEREWGQTIMVDGIFGLYRAYKLPRT